MSTGSSQARRSPSTRACSAIRCRAWATSSPASTGSRGSCTSTRPSPRSDGHTVKLPPDRGEGQQWSSAPGNLYSAPVKMRIDPSSDRAAPRVARQEDSAAAGSARHEVRQAHQDPERAADEVLGPADVPRRARRPARGMGHASARALSAGDLPRALSARGVGMARDAARSRSCRRPTSPTSRSTARTATKASSATKYGYERMLQEYGYQFYKQWTGPGFPRVIMVTIQHANPYYDDSYAVNSENLGPYGDAITYELIPYIEQTFRGLGPWARGGVRRLDRRVGGARRRRCSTRISTTAPGRTAPIRSISARYTVVNIYEDANAYYSEGPLQADATAGQARLSRADALDRRAEQPDGAGARHQVAIGRPVGHLGSGLLAGRRRRLSQAHLGQADRRDRHDASPPTGASTTISCTSCSATGRRSAPKLRGKITLNVGLSDNYFLNNAVYLRRGVPAVGEARRPTRASTTG